MRWASFPHRGAFVVAVVTRYINPGKWGYADKAATALGGVARTTQRSRTQIQARACRYRGHERTDTIHGIGPGSFEGWLPRLARQDSQEATGRRGVLGARVEVAAFLHIVREL